MELFSVMRCSYIKRTSWMWQILFGIIFFVGRHNVSLVAGKRLAFVTTNLLSTEQQTCCRLLDHNIWKQRVPSTVGGIFTYNQLYNKLPPSEFYVGREATLWYASNLPSSDFPPASSPTLKTTTTTSTNPTTTSNMEKCLPKPLTMLALHGSGGTGASLEEILLHWNFSRKRDTGSVSELQAQQKQQRNDNVDADNGTSDEISTEDDATAVNSLLLDITTVTGVVPMEKGFSWWKLGDGERSFTADTYNGFEQSKTLVLDAIQQQQQQQNQPFDIIFGHSQGAILLTALLALNAIGSCANSKYDQHHQHPTIGYILNGVAWPNPYSLQLESVQLTSTTSDDGTAPKIRVLVIIGERDMINPPEQAKRVVTALQKAGCDVTVVTHPNGHSIPVDWETSTGSTTWGEAIRKWILL